MLSKRIVRDYFEQEPPSYSCFCIQVAVLKRGVPEIEFPDM